MIPNIELLFYKIFCSPQSTAGIRKGSEDLLAGNLFARENLNLGNAVYRSLLETVALNPKKKHFKKIIEHLISYQDKTQVDPALLELISYIGIDQRFPVLMGQTFKYFLQNDYRVSPANFTQILLFLERCKGFEEDAKRFVALTAETNCVQANYALLRPLFLRTIKNKQAQDVLKMFEQIRKNLKLNKAYSTLPNETKAVVLSEIKKDIYDGLIKDLLAVKAYGLAEVIYTEKLREKFPMSTLDYLTGLEIYACMKKLPEYQARFKEILNGTEVPLDQTVCEELGRTLLEFNLEEHKIARLQMAEQLNWKISANNIKLTESLFDSIVYVYTES